jgi:GMP synthase-like glutamine amidotransferase
MKVCIIHSSPEYAALFLHLGFKLTEFIDEADLVCFTGGADVSPDLYGATKHPRTYNDRYRDNIETKVFEHVKELKKPMVGICRGGQFLNVMSGGSMYQDVTRHTMPHEITDLQTGEKLLVSSTHHQMMKPSPEGILVASSTLGGQREWYEGQVFKMDVSEQDIEVVYYKDTNALCFQPHPEFNGSNYIPMKNYFKGLLNRFFGL